MRIPASAGLLVAVALGPLALPAAAQVFGSGPSDSALFDTVINLPPAPNIGSGQSIGGDGQTTQVNLDDDGFINSSFDVLEGAERPCFLTPDAEGHSDDDEGVEELAA